MEDITKNETVTTSNNAHYQASFVNYDSHIRNNTLICNFIEYDNLLKESDLEGVLAANTTQQDDGNDSDGEPNNNNNLRIRMMKQILNNEDNAVHHFTRPREEKEVSDEINIEDYSVDQLNEYKDYLKQANKTLKQEYEQEDKELSSIYLLNNRLFDLAVERSLKENTIESLLFDSLTTKLNSQGETDLSELLAAFINENKK